MKRLVLPALLAVLVAPLGALGGEREVLLQRGVAAYGEALEATEHGARLAGFRSAQRAFTAAIERGADNAEVYTNLANAALQAEDLGAAVLAYRRALARDPDHIAARDNLAHARSLLPEWVPRPVASEGFVDEFFSWHRSLAFGDRLAASAGVFAIAGVLLAGAIRWRRTSLRNLAVVAGLVWVALASSVGVDWFVPPPPAAVLVAPETVARSADSSRAAPRFSQPLPAGTEVEIVAERAGWTQVRLANARSAWLPSGSLAPLTRERRPDR